MFALLFLLLPPLLLGSLAWYFPLWRLIDLALLLLWLVFHPITRSRRLLAKTKRAWKRFSEQKGYTFLDQSSPEQSFQIQGQLNDVPFLIRWQHMPVKCPPWAFLFRFQTDLYTLIEATLPFSFSGEAMLCTRVNDIGSQEFSTETSTNDSTFDQAFRLKTKKNSDFMLPESLTPKLLALSSLQPFINLQKNQFSLHCQGLIYHPKTLDSLIELLGYLKN